MEKLKASRIAYRNLKYLVSIKRVSIGDFEAAIGKCKVYFSRTKSIQNIDYIETLSEITNIPVEDLIHKNLFEDGLSQRLRDEAKKAGYEIISLGLQRRVE